MKTNKAHENDNLVILFISKNFGVRLLHIQKKLAEPAYIMKSLFIQLFLYFTHKGKCVLMEIA